MSYDPEDFEKYDDYAPVEATLTDGIPSGASAAVGTQKRDSGSKIPQVKRKYEEHMFNGYNRADVFLIAEEAVEVMRMSMLRTKPRVYVRGFWKTAMDKVWGWRRVKLRGYNYALIHIDDVKWVYHNLEHNEVKALWILRAKPWQKSYIKNQVPEINSGVRYDPMKAPENSSLVDGNANLFGPIWRAV